MKECFFILFLIVPFYVFSQNIKIDGKVTDIYNNPISNVNIVCKSQDGNIITYTKTNESGVYKIIAKSNETKIEIKFSHIGFQQSSEIIQSVVPTLNKVLEKNNLELQEIVIKREKLKDTLKIKTDKMNLNERSSLREILSKTEGFNVTDDGKINFRGRKIDKILINKKEVFINQNKIALDNLDYGMMEDLQLINNYKDKFDITANTNAESVINVNAKKSFNGVLKHNEDISYGHKDKYFEKMKVLYFSDKLNIFSISGVNNIGAKDFSYNDFSKVYNDASLLFKENFVSYFNENTLLKKAFDLNSNVTLRKEGKKSRKGITLYYTNLDNQGFTQNNTQNNSFEDIKKETIENREKGLTFSYNFNSNFLLGKTKLLLVKSNLLYNKSNYQNNKFITNYLSNATQYLYDNTSFSPKSFLFTNELTYKSRIQNNFILISSLKNFYEHTTQNTISSYFINNSNNSIFQQFDIKNLYLTYELGIQKKYDNYFLSANLISNSKNEVAFNKNLTRTNYDIGIELYLGYDAKKVNIKSQITPKIFTVNNHSSIIYNTNTEFKYHFNSNSDIGISYFRNTELYDLYKCADTIQTAFNNRTINKYNLSENITIQNNIELSYYYSNISKSKSFSFISSYNIKENPVITLFDSFQNNVFYYINTISNNQKNFSIESRFSKGYYISKKYDKIIGTISSNFKNFKTPLVISNNDTNSIINNYGYSTSLGFESKSKNVPSIYYSFSNNIQFNYLDNNLVNKNTIYTHSVDINKKLEKFDVSIIVGSQLNKNNDFNFSTPFCNLKLNCNLTKKLTFFIKGKYLFHLFNLPNTNYTNFSTNFDGNFVYTTYNNYNLNYLIAGLTFKL